MNDLDDYFLDSQDLDGEESIILEGQLLNNDPLEDKAAQILDGQRSEEVTITRT